jgi:hypothetical protein
MTVKRNHRRPEAEVVARGVAAGKGGEEAEVRKMRESMQANL